MTEFLKTAMTQAVNRAVSHVENGGIPFVGVIVEGDRIIFEFGVNRVHETCDPTAHAEIVAIRSALATTGRADLRGTTLLATGEPCGMCYRYALDCNITDIRVSVLRNQVATLGFDYRSSYLAFGITDAIRAAHMRLLRVPGDTEPFTRFRNLHH